MYTNDYFQKIIAMNGLNNGDTDHLKIICAINIYMHTCTFTLYTEK